MRRCGPSARAAQGAGSAEPGRGGAGAAGGRGEGGLDLLAQLLALVAEIAGDPARGVLEQLLQRARLGGVGAPLVLARDLPEDMARHDLDLRPAIRGKPVVEVDAGPCGDHPVLLALPRHQAGNDGVFLLGDEVVQLDVQQELRLALVHDAAEAALLHQPLEELPREPVAIGVAVLLRPPVDLHPHGPGKRSGLAASQRVGGDRPQEKGRTAGARRRGAGDVAPGRRVRSAGRRSACQA